MAKPTPASLKNQFKRLMDYAQDNIQPPDLKRKPFARDGKNNLRGRVFAAGAAAAVLHYCMVNEIDFEPSNKGRLGELYEKYTFEIDGGTFAVPNGKRRLSDPSNAAAHDKYVADFKNGFNVQIEELKKIHPGTAYPEPMDADSIGDAIGLTRDVVDRL